jgi:hypothetical protein
MFNRYKYYLLAVLAVVLFVGANSVYIVAQPEQAIVLQFGEPMRLVKEPGLKFKVPFIQNVVIYDTRLLNLDRRHRKSSLMTKNVSTLTVSPAIKSLIRCVFTKPSAPKSRPAANWRKSSILPSVKFSAALLCRNCSPRNGPRL